MSKLQLRKRTTETKNLNLGKVILFCEGSSEKYYFDYFANIINNQPNKYNNVIVQTQDVGGNAQTVLNFADKFLSDEKNNTEYSEYGKYLIFDCDSPPYIQSVIVNAINNKNNYILLVSNHFFETWLLMHFEDVNTKLTKRNTYIHLSSHLSSHYKKADKGLIREILSNGEIEKAIDFAKQLHKEYDSLGYNYQSSIEKMNPFSNVYILVEELMKLIS